MRTWLAAILTAMLLLQGAAAVAEAADTATAAADGTAVLTASDIAKLGRPASDTPTHITVGSPTRVSGMLPRRAAPGSAMREPRTASARPAAIGATRSGICSGWYWASPWRSTTTSTPASTAQR